MTLLPTVTDATAAIILIAVLYTYWKGYRMQYEYSDDELEPKTLPRVRLPGKVPAWTPAQGEGFRIDLESAEWIIERQREEIKRMHAVSTEDAETIAALNERNAWLNRAYNEALAANDRGEAAE